MIVSASLTFQLISTVWGPFSTLTTKSSNAARNIFYCAGACGSYGTCGGIVWDPAQSPSCQLVVDPSEAGSEVSYSTSAYRLANYKDDLQLKELLPGPGDLSWNSATAACSMNGFELLPHPATMKQRAILSIRRMGFSNVNLIRRQSDGAYMDSEDQIVPETDIIWGGSNPGLGNHYCLGIGYTPLAYYDWPCDSDDPTAEILCVG